MIASSDPNKNQTETDQIVTYPPAPVYTHLNTDNVPCLYQPQPVAIMSNGANINQPQPVAIMSNGANINQFQPVAIMSNGANINQPQPVAVMSIGANINQIVYISEYTGWSIFNILCCCVILGILACVKSRETRDRKRFGDLQGALKASKSAKILNICATVIGIIIIIIAAILQATSTVKIYSYSNA